MKNSKMKENTTNNETAFCKNLLSWYEDSKRNLPWRQDPSPYHVWISEIMLQQTRVEAAKGYYTRFLDALPTIDHLASAKEDTYLKLWEGLGYYSRVRNLHKAANVVVAEYHSQLPSEYHQLLKLPGIGPYTAAAIASISFGQPVPAIDGNLLRIFSRLTEYKESILTTTAKKAADVFFKAHISPKNPGAFNQALMDLGAAICLPNTTPHCQNCPVSNNCSAYLHGTQMQLPNRPKQKNKTIEKRTVFLIHVNDSILLGKRPAKGLLAGLYEFPGVESHLSKKVALEYVESLGFEPLRIHRLPDSKHVFSHKEWHMRGYQVFTSGWTDFSRHQPKAVQTIGNTVDNTMIHDTASLPEADALVPGQLFLANQEDVLSTWSIPSAFSFYRDYLLGNISSET